MWMDVRASDQAERIAETGDPALKYNGYGAVSAEWGLPKALWLKEHEPDDLRAARPTSATAATGSIHRLTGEWTASINMASLEVLLRPRRGRLPGAACYEAVGVERRPREASRRGCSTWAPSSAACARTSAEELGLRPGTPVAEGGIDAYVGALGLGVVEPGKLALITGSSHVLIGQTAEPIHDQGFWGAYTDAMIPGQYTVEAGQASTGTVVAWFKNHFAGEAIARGGSGAASTPTRSSTSWPREVPVGSDGLIVARLLPGQPLAAHRPARARHDLGPVAEPRPRPRVPGHHRGHLLRHRGHLPDHARPRLRAAAERRLRRADQRATCGCSSTPTSPTCRSRSRRSAEGPVLGSAMLAAVGAGIHPDLPDGRRRRWSTPSARIEPDPARHEEYRFWVDRYIETYPAHEGPDAPRSVARTLGGAPRP